MEISEMRDLSPQELESKLDDTRDELFRLRFQLQTGQLTDVSRIKATRRAIAKLETVLRERQLAAVPAGEGK